MSETFQFKSNNEALVPIISIKQKKNVSSLKDKKKKRFKKVHFSSLSMPNCFSICDQWAIIFLNTFLTVSKGTKTFKSSEFTYKLAFVLKN